MLRFAYVEGRTLKRHTSIEVFVVYIDTGVQRRTFHRNHMIWRMKISFFDGMEMIRKNCIAGGCVPCNFMLCEANKSMI